MSWFHPLDVTVTFEDRTYKLGESIDVAVELSAHDSVQVREGSINLICDEQWVDMWIVQVSAYRWGRVSDPGISRRLPQAPITKRGSHVNHERFYPSSARLLRNERLSPGTPYLYDARLDIPPEGPPHAYDATVSWQLVATFDVVRARDVTESRTVTVTLI